MFSGVPCESVHRTGLRYPWVFRVCWSVFVESKRELVIHFFPIPLAESLNVQILSIESMIIQIINLESLIAQVVDLKSMPSQVLDLESMHAQVLNLIRECAVIHSII